MYEIFIKCDREGCNSRVQVSQPGALPTGWLALQWQKVSLQLAGKGNNPEQGRQLVTNMFCSWKCAMHFVKQFLTEKAD